MGQSPPDYLRNLYIGLPSQKREGSEETELIPFGAAWGLFSIQKKVGVDAVIKVAKIGALAIKGDDLNLEDATRLGSMIGRLVNSLEEQFEDEEEFLLHATYQGLRQKLITREQAAEVVAWLTGKPMKSDTWRKKMDKYIDAHGLDPVGLSMGRPKRAKSENKNNISD